MAWFQACGERVGGGSRRRSRRRRERAVVARAGGDEDHGGRAERQTRRGRWCRRSSSVPATAMTSDAVRCAPWDDARTAANRSSPSGSMIGEAVHDRPAVTTPVPWSSGPPSLVATSMRRRMRREPVDDRRRRLHRDLERRAPVGLRPGVEDDAPCGRRHCASSWRIMSSSRPGARSPVHPAEVVADLVLAQREELLAVGGLRARLHRLHRGHQPPAAPAGARGCRGCGGRSGRRSGSSGSRSRRATPNGSVTVSGERADRVAPAPRRRDPVRGPGRAPHLGRGGSENRAARRPSSNMSVTASIGVVRSDGCATQRGRRDRRHPRAGAPAAPAAGGEVEAPAADPQRADCRAGPRPPVASTASSTVPRSRPATNRPAAAPTRLQPRRVRIRAPACRRLHPSAPGTGTEAHHAAARPRSRRHGARRRGRAARGARARPARVASRRRGRRSRVRGWRRGARGPLERQRAAWADPQREVAVVDGSRRRCRRCTP